MRWMAAVGVAGWPRLQNRPPNQASAAIPNAAPARRPRRVRDMARGAGAAVERTSGITDGDASACTNCAAGLKRSAGFLASVRCSAPATSGGTAGRRFVIGAASATRCCRVIGFRGRAR